MSDDGKSDGLEQTAETILVIDSNILVRMAIAEYLRDCGFRVIEAMNGDEAMIVIQQSSVSVNIVLSDVEMTGSLDGFGLAKWIRAHMPAIPVILAGSPESAAKAAGNLCESGPLLAKPYEPQALLARIRQILAAVARTTSKTTDA